MLYTKIDLQDNPFEKVMSDFVVRILTLGETKFNQEDAIFDAVRNNFSALFD